MASLAEGHRGPSVTDRANRKAEGSRGRAGEAPYQVVHQVFQCGNWQHYHQGDQRRVPRQGGDVWDELGKRNIKGTGSRLSSLTGKRPSVVSPREPARWEEPGSRGWPLAWTARTDSGAGTWTRCTCTSWWRFPEDEDKNNKIRHNHRIAFDALGN